MSQQQKRYNIRDIANKSVGTDHLCWERRSLNGSCWFVVYGRYGWKPISARQDSGLLRAPLFFPERSPSSTMQHHDDATTPDSSITFFLGVKTPSVGKLEVIYPRFLFWISHSIVRHKVPEKMCVVCQSQKHASTHGHMCISAD